jgi:hypothetical protein
MMFLFSLPHKFTIPMFIERYVSFVSPAFFIGISIFVVKITEDLKNKSKYSKFIPLALCLIMCLGIKNKTNTNIFKQYHDLTKRDSMPKKTIIQPYYGAFSYLYYNDQSNFKDFASSKIYDHMERQLAAQNIYTSRKNSLNLFVSDSLNSIVCIEGELNRKNEIFVIDSFLNSKKYLPSDQVILSGNNYQIAIKKK